MDQVLLIAASVVIVSAAWAWAYARLLEENQRLSERLKDERTQLYQVIERRDEYQHALECIMWMETPKANATVRRMSEAARVALYD